MLQARNLFGAVGALDGFASVQAENPHHRGDEDMELDQAKEDGGATADQQRGEERGMGRDGQFEHAEGEIDQRGHEDPGDRQDRADKQLAEDEQVEDVLVVGRHAARGAQDAQIHAGDDREAEQEPHEIDLAFAVEHETQADGAPDGQGGVEDLLVGSQETDGHDQHENAGEKEHDGAGDATPPYQVALFKAGAWQGIGRGGVPIPPGEQAAGAPEVVIAQDAMGPQIGGHGWLCRLGSRKTMGHSRKILLESDRLK